MFLIKFTVIGINTDTDLNKYLHIDCSRYSNKSSVNQFLQNSVPTLSTKTLIFFLILNKNSIMIPY